MECLLQRIEKTLADIWGVFWLNGVIILIFLDIFAIMRLDFCMLLELHLKIEKHIFR